MLKKLFQFMWDLVEVLIIIYVIFVTTCILSKNRYGYTNLFGYTLVSVHQEDEAYIKDSGVLEFLETRLGFLFCVLLPIMIVFVYQIYEFVVILNYDKADKIRKNEEEIDRQQEKIRLENMKKKEDDNIEIL